MRRRRPIWPADRRGCCETRSDVVGHRARSGTGDDLVGDGAQGGTPPFDGDADLARVEQIVIVFGVADPDRVVDRHPEGEQRLSQSRGFADGLRQDHQATPIEGEDERLFERPDHVENRAGPLRIGLHHRLAGGEGNVASLKLLEEGRTGRMSDQDMPPTRWELEHGAIFGDDRRRSTSGLLRRDEDPAIGVR